MKWLTFKVQRTPGFRFNLIDLGLILGLSGLASTLRIQLPNTSLWALPIYIGISFFLFCNVFRIGNHLEPWWYIPFAVVSGYSIFTMNLREFWIVVASILEPWKWILIGFRIGKGPYTGAFHRRINLYFKRT